MNAVGRNRVRRMMREAFVREYAPLQKLLQESHMAASIILQFKAGSAGDARRLTLQPVRADIAGLCRALSAKLSQKRT
jgi:RNase P protein component